MPETAKKSDEQQELAGVEGAQERERSTISFPYLSLDVAVEIVKAVNSTGGQQSQMEQVAAHLGESANGGAFRTKVVTARIFGLAKYSAGAITLSPLGSRMTDPDQEKAAKAEAFLHVPLYRRIYDDYKASVLPPTAAALEQVMVSLGVAAKQKDKARQTFLRSAQQAGFFAYGSSKLVYPTLTGAEQKTEKSGDHEEPKDRKAKGGGEDGGASDNLHPAIKGLLLTLPHPGSPWPLDGRKKWLLSALSLFDLIYEGSEGNQALTIKLGKGENSAM
jgi:hypothetical protein